MHGKPSLYFGNVSCEETSQNELPSSGEKVPLLYCEGKDIEVVSFPSPSLVL